MKKTTKRMIISVLTLVLTVAALGTTTFAWFSLSTTSQISKIGGNVTGGEGLEVRLVRDGDTKSGWMANIDASTLADFMPTDFKFEAVSTNDTEASSFYMMQQSDAGFITLDGLAEENVHYLEFDIQLRSRTSGVVRLTGLEFPDATEVSFAIDGNPYKQTPDSGENTAHTVFTSARNGARVSISQLDASGTQVEETTQVYQYDDNSLDEVIDGSVTTVQGNHVMGTNGVFFGQWSYLTVSRGLKIYSDVLSDPANPTQLTNPTSITILEAHTNVIDSSTYRTTINLLDDGVGGAEWYSASFRVRIWIEGWDADSYDSIYDALLSVNFTFQKPNLAGQELLIYGQYLLTNMLDSRTYTAGDDNALPTTVANLPVTYEIGDGADPEIFTPLATPFNLVAGTYNIRATITGDVGTTPLQVLHEILVQ